MPTLRLVSPPPDARLPLSFEEREAQARLKFAILMARLRTGLRAVMDANRDWSGIKWHQNVEDEAVSQYLLYSKLILISQSFMQEQVMAHYGYCAINGFRIEVPYLLQDLMDVIFAPEPPVGAHRYTLPASINMTNTDLDDLGILEYTSEHSYWWNKPNAEVEGCRVTRVDTYNQFAEFYNKVCGPCTILNN